MNPWFSIWIRPRPTIRRVVATNPAALLVPLAILGGTSVGLDYLSEFAVGDRLTMGGLLLAATVVGTVLGLLNISLGASLLCWTGRWLGGRATPSEVRTALAWSYVPAIWGLLLWLPMLIFFARDLFTSSGPPSETTPSLIPVLIVFGLVHFIMSIWSTVIHLHCIGEVHCFSAWRALSTIEVAWTISLVALIVLYTVADHLWTTLLSR